MLVQCIIFCIAAFKSEIFANPYTVINVYAEAHGEKINDVVNSCDKNWPGSSCSSDNFNHACSVNFGNSDFSGGCGNHDSNAGYPPQCAYEQSYPKSDYPIWTNPDSIKPYSYSSKQANSKYLTKDYFDEEDYMPDSPECDDNAYKYRKGTSKMEFDEEYENSLNNMQYLEYDSSFEDDYNNHQIQKKSNYQASYQDDNNKNSMNKYPNEQHPYPYKKQQTQNKRFKKYKSSDNIQIRKQGENQLMADKDDYDEISVYGLMRLLM